MAKSKDWRSLTEEDKKFVGRLIKEARFARGLTPSQAAEAMGTGRSNYYRMEQGRIGSTGTRVILWLLRDNRVENMERHDPLYWRERALLAERRLDLIREQVVEYTKIRVALEKDDDGYEPSSGTLLSGTRAQAA